MENGQLHDDKLFRAVNDRLSDYEAPANGADWDAMSRSLDALPRAARFQWRISLNSILVILGITGLSVLGFAVVRHAGNATQKTTAPVAVENKTQPKKNSVTTSAVSLPVQTNSTVNSTPLTTNDVAMNNNSGVNNSNPSDLNNAMQNTVANNDGTTKTKKHKNNELYFGDQIDPNKGFVRGTKENTNALVTPDPIPNPNVFYDIDSATGKTKTIIHRGDSIKNAKPFAPTNSDIQGFDPQAQ